MENIGIETEQIEYKKTTGELKEAITSIAAILNKHGSGELYFCLLYTSPSPRDRQKSRMPSSA